jgi:putative membrane protein
LQNVSQSQFDKAYIQAQIKAHKKTIALFQRFAKEGDQKALKEFAVQTLPVLQKHEERIMALAKLNGLGGNLKREE